MKLKIHSGLDIPIIFKEIEQLDYEKGWSVTIEPLKRSNPQNKLYWMWLKLLADEFGCIPEELHEIYKTSFLGTKKVNVKNKEFVIPNSTSNLNKAQFTDYLHKIEQTAIKYNVYLPRPEDQAWEEFEKKYHK